MTTADTIAMDLIALGLKTLEGNGHIRSQSAHSVIAKIEAYEALVQPGEVPDLGPTPGGIIRTEQKTYSQGLAEALAIITSLIAQKSRHCMSSDTHSELVKNEGVCVACAAREDLFVDTRIRINDIRARIHGSKIWGDAP